jgi:hypothetical protein
MITIREFSDQVEAGLIQSFLSDNEIDSILADENANSWIGVRILVPIRLQVSEEDVEKAKRFLKQFDNASVVPESDCS